MAKREAIIELRLEDKDAVVKLGQIQAETRRVNDSIKLLNSIIDENGKATANQARQLGELLARKKNLSGQARELSNDLSGLTAAGMRFRDKMADATLEAIKQSGILGQLAARADFLDNQLKDLNASYKAGSITQEQYNAQQAKLQSELAQTTSKMTGMDAKLDELNKDFKEGRITAEQFRAGVQSVNTQVAKASGAFSKGIGDLKSYALGFVGVVAVVQGLGMVFSNITRIIADFDKAQSRLAGILGTTKNGMAALTEQAKQLGATTAFTAAQVSDAQTELAKLGFTQNEILAATPALLDLARGAGADIAQAAEIAAGTLNAFGLSAEETTRLADVMAKSFSSTALDINKFSFAMRVVGPVAKNAGLSIEETTALIGVLADNNIRAETSGTGLRNILGKLAQTGMTFEEAMRLINTSTDKTKTAIDLFNSEASTVAIVLAENTTKTEELTEAFDKAAGSAKDLAVAMDDNLIGDKLKLQSAWEGFVLSVDTGSGVISKSLRGITNFFQGVLGYLTIINSTPDILGRGIAPGKGEVLKAEQATKAYREELERLIQVQASELGWKDKSLASTLALNNLTFEQIDKMREFARVRFLSYKAQGKIDEATLLARQKIADIDARIASARDERERSKIFQEQALERAKYIILLKELEKTQASTDKATEESVVVTEADTAATNKNTEAKRLQRQEVQGLTKGMRDLIQAYDDLEKGTVRVMSIRQPQIAGAPLPGVPVGSGDAMITNPENFPGTAIVNDMKANAGELETLTTDYANLFMNMSTAIGESLGDAFSGVEDANQKIVISILEMVRNAARMYIAMAFFREIGTKGFAGIATGTALTVAMEAILAAAINGVQQGFEEGGYTPRRSSDKAPVGVVHANEYVVPADMVRDPRYSPVIDALERARRGLGFGMPRGQYFTGGYGDGLNGSFTLTEKIGVPRPSPGELRATAFGAEMRAMAERPIFVRVAEINQVQGQVARVTERSIL